MPVDLIALGSACFAVSALLTRVVIKVASAHGLLDVPNVRSSHTRPKPRGGGVAVVTTATAGFALLAVSRRLDTALCAALAGGLVVALIGFLDDRRPLPATVRLAAHLAAAVWAVVWLGGLPPLRVGMQVISFGWPGYLLAALGVVWAINLFNFMDGIDGIAASEAIFIAIAGGQLSQMMGAAGGVVVAATVFAAACGGFLLWNWPPARIFIGDVGSGYLGYVIVVLAMAATRDNAAALWVWLTLGGVFFVDATVTLVRRIVRNEHVHQAHRCHAYQWLARRWNSHSKVTIAVLAMDVLWLLPCALFAARQPRYALLAVIIAFAPVAVLALAVGAGRREADSARS